MSKLGDWYRGLSTAGRVGVMSGAFILGFGTLVAATPTTPNPADGNAVKAAETVKEPVVTTETVAESEVIPFGKKSIETHILTKGVTQVTTAGVDGVRTKTYTVTKTDGLETHRVLASDVVTTAPVDEVTSLGTYVAPSRAAAPQTSSSGCDPNYSGGCVPVVSYDLDCPDIGFNVVVIGSDPHGFDGSDNDGLGCESY